MPSNSLDFLELHRLREQRVPWREIHAGTLTEKSEAALRAAYRRWCIDTGTTQATTTRAIPGEPARAVPPPDLEGTLTSEDLHQIRSLEDLLRHFDVDPDLWEVKHFSIRGGSWDQSVEKGHVARSFRVSATLQRRQDLIEEDLKRVWADLKADAEAHVVPALPTLVVPPDPEADVLAVIALMDPHLGMRAWGQEVGEDWDTNLAVAAYGDAIVNLLGWAEHYPVEKFLYLVGNDLIHADLNLGGKGASTWRGTPQDVDTRLDKLFSLTRSAVVHGVDLASQIAPVDVMCVPGNHDRTTVYRLAEVLSAWYRGTDDVNVLYGPEYRKFYGYGSNALLLTHGEEYLRRRDNLALIMATECPADIWTASENGVREVLCGHNHRSMSGRYTPTSDLSETRGIRVRSLPALTPIDSWHYDSGFRHYRAATLLLYQRDGGLIGQHEVRP
jgi:hypothetical protein